MISNTGQSTPGCEKLLCTWTGSVNTSSPEPGRQCKNIHNSKPITLISSIEWSNKRRGRRGWPGGPSLIWWRGVSSRVSLLLNDSRSGDKTWPESCSNYEYDELLTDTMHHCQRHASQDTAEWGEIENTGIIHWIISLYDWQGYDHICAPVHHIPYDWLLRSFLGSLLNESFSVPTEKKYISPPTLKYLEVNQEVLSIRWGRYIGQFPSKGLYNQYEWDSIHIITNIISF